MNVDLKITESEQGQGFEAKKDQYSDVGLFQFSFHFNYNYLEVQA